MLPVVARPQVDQDHRVEALRHHLVAAAGVIVYRVNAKAASKRDRKIAKDGGDRPISQIMKIPRNTETGSHHLVEEEDQQLSSGAISK